MAPQGRFFLNLILMAIASTWSKRGQIGRNPHGHWLSGLLMVRLTGQRLREKVKEVGPRKVENPISGKR